MLQNEQHSTAIPRCTGDAFSRGRDCTPSHLEMKKREPIRQNRPSLILTLVGWHADSQIHTLHKKTERIRYDYGI